MGNAIVFGHSAVTLAAGNLAMTTSNDDERPSAGRPRIHADAAARKRAWRARRKAAGLPPDQGGADTTGAERQARYRDRQEAETAAWWRDSVRLHAPDDKTVEAVISRYLDRAPDRQAAVQAIAEMLAGLARRNT